MEKGKEHCIADSLSRAPVNDPNEDDTDYGDHKATIVAALCATITDDDDEDHRSGRLIDPVLEDLHDAARNDEEYAALIQEIENDFRGLNSAIPFVHQFKAIRHELTVEDGLVLYGPRIVIPAAKRKDTLERLHASHQGITRTQQRARLSVYWPGINHELRTMIEKCSPCQERLPSLPRETLKTDPMPKRPFEEVAADMFYHAGRHYLIYADRVSGFPIVAEWSDESTAQQVEYQCRKFFANLRVPIRFRYDNGPQFASKTFKDFLTRWGVQLNTSTPSYPQANYAEVNVQKVKTMNFARLCWSFKTRQMQMAAVRMR